LVWFLVFWHRSLLCSLGWPWIRDPPISASQVLGSQVCDHPAPLNSCTLWCQKIKRQWHQKSIGFLFFFLKSSNNLQSESQITKSYSILFFFVMFCGIFSRQLPKVLSWHLCSKLKMTKDLSLLRK
jgi:hypothetical protein